MADTEEVPNSRDGPLTIPSDEPEPEVEYIFPEITDYHRNIVTGRMKRLKNIERENQLIDLWTSKLHHLKTELQAEKEQLRENMGKNDLLPSILGKITDILQKIVTCQKKIKGTEERLEQFLEKHQMVELKIETDLANARKKRKAKRRKRGRPAFKKKDGLTRDEFLDRSTAICLHESNRFKELVDLETGYMFLSSSLDKMYIGTGTNDQGVLMAPCPCSRPERGPGNNILQELTESPCLEQVHIKYVISQLPKEMQQEIYPKIQNQYRILYRGYHHEQCGTVNCPFCIDPSYLEGYGYKLEENWEKLPDRIKNRGAFTYRIRIGQRRELISNLDNCRFCPTCESTWCQICACLYTFTGSETETGTDEESHNGNSCGFNNVDTWIDLNCKRCPGCSSPVEKNGGCNHMCCRKCGAHFCWTCLAQFETANAVYNHMYEHNNRV